MHTQSLTRAEQTGRRISLMLHGLLFVYPCNDIVDWQCVRAVKRKNKQDDNGTGTKPSE